MPESASSPMEKKGPTPFSTSWKAFSKMNMTSEKWSAWLRKTTRLLQLQKSWTRSQNGMPWSPGEVIEEVVHHAVCMIRWKQSSWEYLPLPSWPPNLSVLPNWCPGSWVRKIILLPSLITPSAALLNMILPTKPNRPSKQGFPF